MKREENDRGHDFTPLHPILAAFQLTIVWLFSFLYLVPISIFSMLTLGVFSMRIVSAVARGYGRTVLWILGIRLEVEGMDRLNILVPRVIVTNHSSTLDLPILAAVFPRGGMALAKKELFWIPFIGQVWWALGQIFIDRGHSKKARASIDRASRVLIEQKRTVIMTPEGTRSRDGSLGPFKMGAFHIALTSRTPIIPLLIVGSAARLPCGDWRVRPGVIRVKVYEPIETTDWTRESLRKNAESIREHFRHELARERKRMGIELAV